MLPGHPASRCRSFLLSGGLRSVYVFLPLLLLLLLLPATGYRLLVAVYRLPATGDVATATATSTAFVVGPIDNDGDGELK